MNGNGEIFEDHRFRNQLGAPTSVQLALKFCCTVILLGLRSLRP